MLKVSPFAKYDDLTVLQDDAKWTLFAILPSLPLIRRDDEGRPVFLLTVFHTSDQDRETRPDLPKGGGFMNFDVQFAVEEEAGKAAREKLQQWVDEEYARRRADPQYAGQAEYADAEPPKIEITDPLLSGGTVKMETTQSAQLVSHRLAENTASLVAGSTACFNLDLTETGASFMKELFLNKDGSGRVDLTPVSVSYDLRMWARLPPVTITVTGNSERIHKTMQSVSQTHGDNWCTPAVIETYRESTVNSSSLKEAGLVEVRIDKGDATVPEEVLGKLQDYALDLFDTMIAERFMVPADAETPPLDFDDDDPQVAAQPGAPRLARRHHRPWRARPWGTQVGRYKVRESLDEASMKLEIKIERSQVVEWPIVARATLATFFAGASEAEMQRHIVDLHADDFNTLGVTVQSLVTFDKTPVQAVEVQLEYSATDDRGETHLTPNTFTFTATDNAARKFDPTIINGQREYRSRYRVIYDDGSSGDYTPWVASTSRGLNIAVTDPGGIALDVSAASLNWDLLRGIRVDLGYTHPDDAQATAQRSFELTKLNPGRKWEQKFNRALRGAANAKVTYFLADEKVVEGPNLSVDVTNTLFLVPPPQVDVLNVTLLPSGDWSDVAQALVQMKYDAGDGRVYDRVFRFTAIDQSAEWQVLLRDATRRGFSYQSIVAYKSGGRDESAWTTKTGDQALPIDVKGSPKLKVNVLSNLIDFARTPAVQVSFVYGDQRRTLAFTEKKTQVFETPLLADGTREYGYTVTWFPASGAPISSGPQRSADTELFLRPAPLPVAGKLDVQVRGFAVDWTATPFVDVALEWQDATRDERATLTLSKDKPTGTWSVEVPDRTQRRYRYAITYNRADGSRVPGASGETDDPVISVTRHQP